MNKLSVVARAAALAISLAASGLAVAQSAPLITTVNGKPVTQARADLLLQQATRPGQQQQPRTKELEVQVRDEVVLREMFLQEAVRRGLSTTPKYRDQIQLARESILIRELFADHQSKNPVTEAEVKAEYERIKKESGNNEIRARHILVADEAQAKSLIAQIKGGAKFDELAKKFSKDEGSARNGGDLDWANPGSYVPEFSQALAKLGKGEVTAEPVKSSFGYHVIKVDDTREVAPPTLESLEPRIRQHLNQTKLEQFREDIKAKSKTTYQFQTAAPAQ